jgi:hypothetical protein
MVFRKGWVSRYRVDLYDSGFLIRLRGGNAGGWARMTNSKTDVIPLNGLARLRESQVRFAMPIFREGRVIRHLAVEAEPTEPTVSEVQVNLLTQPPLGTNAVAVAYQQHPDEQFGINRRPASGAVKWRQVAPNV